MSFKVTGSRDFVLRKLSRTNPYPGPATPATFAPMDTAAFRTFHPSQLEELITFARAYPWHSNWPEDMMRRFLSEFSSGPGSVLDLHDRERVAVAVLVDKVSNPGNNAPLEILGCRKGVEPREIVLDMLKEAQARVQPPRTGIEFSVHESFGVFDADLAKLDLHPYYEMFDMRVAGLRSMSLGPSEDFRLAVVEDEAAIYALLRESFKHNPDISIPDFTSWQTSRRKSAHSLTFLADAKGELQGFLSLMMHEGRPAEIRTVGVLPGARGRGLGRSLLIRALYEVRSRGRDECVLSVAVQNQNALRLYQGLGFAISDHHRVFRWNA